MSKQTVEEEAKLFIGYPRDPLVNMNAYEKGFVDGSSFGSKWQKEQGIDWISCDKSLPEKVRLYDHGDESARVLLTNGEQIEYSFYIWLRSGEQYGWHSCNFKPTHWAIINLPKTD